MVAVTYGVARAVAARPEPPSPAAPATDAATDQNKGLMDNLKSLLKR